ncbi:hypothetical protein R6Q59_029751 [Mikania micrantha]
MVAAWQSLLCNRNIIGDSFWSKSTFKIGMVAVTGVDERRYKHLGLFLDSLLRWDFVVERWGRFRQRAKIVMAIWPISTPIYVLIRTRSEPELEPCWTRVHMPSYASHCYQPTTHCANCSAPVPQEQNVVPYAASYHGRILHSSSVDTNASGHNPSIRGNLASSSPNPHHVQPARDGCSYHYQRVTPFNRNDAPNGVNSSTNELHFLQMITLPDIHGERGSGYRVRRPWIAVWRPQPLVDMMDSSNGFVHETVTVEHQSFYHEATNFPEPYQDMRLDIDSMSYESWSVTRNYVESWECQQTFSQLGVLSVKKSELEVFKSSNPLT